MPKISKRRQPHGFRAQQLPRSGLAIPLQQARKVSFEESSAASSSTSLKSSSQSSSCGALIPRTSPCSNMQLMNALMERSPTPCKCLCDNDVTPRSSSPDECTSASASSSASPWGQFVDVIPHDDDDSRWREEEDGGSMAFGGCHQWWDDEPSFRSSPDANMLRHSSPAYHPYSNSSNSARKGGTSSMSMAGLPSIPNKRSLTRKLQPRKATNNIATTTTVDTMEGAFEQLRF